MVFLALLLATPHAHAALTATQTVVAVNQDAVSLTLSSNLATFGVVSPAVNNGVVEVPNAAVLVVRSNKPWVLKARIEQDLTAGDAGVIPAAQLRWRRKDSSYTPFVRDTAIIIAQGAATEDAGRQIVLDYQLKVLWNDAPGTYSTAITFELATTE